MSKVIVIGGHGKVARLLVPMLVAAGHTVTAVIRSQDQVADVEQDGADAVVADVETMGVLELVHILRGQDVVVWSAGAGGGNPSRTYRVDRDAAILTMQAALRAGVRRFVMVSWSGSRIDHEFTEDDGFYPYAQSKAIADAVLRDTALDWTIVAPSTLTNEPGTGGVDKAPPARNVSRTDVAAVIAQVIADPSSVGRTVRFNGGDTPIEEFVRA